MKNILTVVAGLLLTLPAFSKTVTPKTVSELKETSVRIMNLEKSSGGTGSILKSFDNATHILTNRHVCRLIEPGGIVNYKDKDFLVTHYKKFENHDLCLVRITQNLDITTQISETIAEISSKVIVSGHPSLLPHIVTTGHLSERQEVQIVSGLKDCTEEDYKEIPQYCALFGGRPIIKSFDAQLISNLIKPGNSGSAVFNEEGKIVGVVFAGDGGDFSYGYIVPQVYLYYFLQNADKFKWVKVGTKVDDEGMRDRVFNYEKCKYIKLETDTKYTDVKDFCKKINDNMIWRK